MGEAHTQNHHQTTNESKSERTERPIGRVRAERVTRKNLLLLLLSQTRSDLKKGKKKEEWKWLPPLPPEEEKKRQWRFGYNTHTHTHHLVSYFPLLYSDCSSSRKVCTVVWEIWLRPPFILWFFRYPFCMAFCARFFVSNVACRSHFFLKRTKYKRHIY